MSNNDNDQYEDRDDYIVQSVVAKAEERKIMMDPKFEAVCARFWHLMQASYPAARSKETLTKQMYCDLMSRLYRVLAPLYREVEMAAEVAQEWVYDVQGQKEMTLGLFQKALFRVAHQWCTHIDLGEYCHLLTQLFDRISHKKIVRADGSTEDVLPQIRVEVTQTREDADDAQSEEDEWEEVDEDEDEEDGYEYRKSGERKFRRRIPADEADEEEAAEEEEEEDVYYTTRDPFTFKETVVYHEPDSEGAISRQPASSTDCEYFVLTEQSNVFPMGYPCEQFFSWLKNDVHKAFQKLKEDKKQMLAAMKRDLFADAGAGMQQQAVMDQDPGLLPEEKQVQKLHFKMHNSKDAVKIDTFVQMKDNHYNAIRTMFKDSSQVVIRPEVPKLPKLKRDHPDAPVDVSGTLTRKTAFGFNPCLERRLNYRLVQVNNKHSQFVNVNYLIADPVYETAYRCDVRRVETSEKMALKPGDEFLREEEFCNVTTSFAHAKQIMLQKKFETLFTVKLQGDEEHAMARDNKVYDIEKARKRNARIKEAITSKGMAETHEGKDFLRLMRGPFYQLISQEGPREDLYDCMGTQDLIDSANKEPMRVLLLGKPRSGKTTLANELQTRLNLLRVSPDVWLNKLFAKIKDREENPPDEDPEPELEEGQEPPPKKSWLEPLEEAVMNSLKAGGAPDSDQIIAMIKELVNSPEANTRGFVLDLDFTKEGQHTWEQRLKLAEVMGDQSFTHIVELLMEDSEIKLRTKHIRATADKGRAFSRWERTEARKPKPKGDDDEDEPEEDEDEENPNKLPAESELVSRVCDEQSSISAQLDNYNNAERPDFDQQISGLYHSTYLRVFAAGLTPSELAETVQYRLKPAVSEPLTPVATIIEGAGDKKGLLTEGLAENEDGDVIQLPRTWSLWRDVDPVLLQKGTVARGEAEWACHYANNVFVFKSEENRNEFVKEPRKFLMASPEMPPEYRVLMLGPSCSGVHSQAEKLQELYGWRTVDFPKIVRAKLQEVLDMPVKPPNNITDEGPCMVCLSEQELQDIKDGKMFPAWKFLPWICEFLGIPLMKRPPPPPEEEKVINVEEMEPDERKAYEKEQKKLAEAQRKKEKEEEEQRKATEERRAKRRQEAQEAGLEPPEDTEEEPVIDDLPLDQLVPAFEEGEEKPKMSQFILLGYPQSEASIAKLKEYGFDFDQVIFLNDTGENELDKENPNEPGLELRKRHKAARGNESSYDWEKQNEQAQKDLAAIKEFIAGENEGLVKEIDCNGSPDRVFIKIRTAIDPFFLLPDSAEDYRTTEADVNIIDDPEEGVTKWLPKGDFGDYCPVTYVNANWLVKGNREFEATVHGKTYWFAGEKERDDFNVNPTKYLSHEVLPLAPPAPKIMILGDKGSGVTTQIEKLCSKFKIESCQLMKEYLAKLDSEAQSRRRMRELKRGFRPIEQDPDAEEEAKDPEIEEDPEEYLAERATHEQRYLQEMLDCNKSLVMDGHWSTLPEGAIEQTLQELLEGARRMPEMVIVLRCNEKSTFDRCIDTDAIKAKVEEDTKIALEKIAADREKEKAEKRAELEEENKQDPEDEGAKSPEEVAKIVEDALAEWETEKIAADEEAWENDEEKPDFEKRLEEEQEKLKEQREKDDAFLEEFVTTLKEKNVEVVNPINTEVSADFVQIKILDALKARMQHRNDLIEREQCVTLSTKEVAMHEKSYTYKHSKFGLASPLSPFSPVQTKEHAVLYRERIYFPSTAGERKKFMLDPSKYTMEMEPVPLDLPLRPTACVIGLPRSGKSTLCETIAAKTGMVHLQPESIIEFFESKDSYFSESIRSVIRGKGREVDEATLVELIQRRIGLRDCCEHGWILEGFPQTRTQAVRLAEAGIVPHNVFHLQLPIEEVYKRTAADVETDFGCDRTILKRRVEEMSKNLPEVAYFYQKYYNALRHADALKSRWYIEDLATDAIEAVMKARLSFSRDYFFKLAEHGEERPCVMQNLNYDRILTKQSISQYGYVCPVTWRQNKKFVSCAARPEYAVLFQNTFYYFAGEAERDIFLKNPRVFTEKVIFSSERNVPQRLRQHKSSEIVAQEKALIGHCPVTLKDEERIEKGQQLIVVSFKDIRFVFASQEKAARFFATPSRYANVQLPVKMPPSKDPVGLHSLQKQDDSITFMEQALGQVVTRGLREVGENRLKYPTLSVKETMLKLFAIFLKAENPANTEYMRDKYRKKMSDFIYKCEVPVELHDLSAERTEKARKDRAWPGFKEDYYTQLGAKYDQIMAEVGKERSSGFSNYIK